ncbi:MAG: M1 family aminopeptidase [Ignavibacteria bacterium]|nr:M1 family aminopeptidase [Ignavibacteria bacterium]
MGKRILILLIFILSVVFNSKSSLIFNEEIEFIEFYCKQKDLHQKTDFTLNLNEKNYDVLEYDLYLDWYNVMRKPTSMDSVDKVWYGINTIKLKNKVPELDNIELEAVSLIIDSVFVFENNSFKKLLPTPKIAGRKLIIPLQKKLSSNEITFVKIYYTYARNVPEDNYRGFFLYPKGKYVGRLPAPFYDSVFVEERIAYTMSEPEDARYWMPCNDAPYDKSDAKITVRVPKDYVVASNGYLEKIVNDGDSAKIFYWVSDKPITTYLMSVAVSKYFVYSHWYKKVTSPNDSLEIQYYVWEKDYYATKTDGSEYNARNTFQTTPKMMEFFSKTFIEYPFVKYGMAVLMPFHFGGMEHQTITSINRAWLRQNVQFGIAHELAHHWIGDLVTCATWNDIWFNEGGATWSEALYAESLWGDWGYNLFLLSSRKEYLKKGGISLPPIYGLPINTIFGDYAVLVYQKASWVYHMLCEMLGDTLFFKTFRNLLKDYSYNSITTEELIQYFKNSIPNPPIKFETFFDQWLYKAGHPIFSINSSIHSYQNDTGYYDAEIIVSQIQTGLNVPDVFTTPIRIIFKNGEKEIRKTFIASKRLDIFQTDLPFFPDSIFIDTTFVLCEIGNITLSKFENNHLDKPFVYPNPIGGNQSAFIKLNSNIGSFVEIEIQDFIGRQFLSKKVDVHNSAGILEISEVRYLPKGVYFVQLKNEKLYNLILYKN